jgi:hypothetical protein
MNERKLSALQREYRIFFINKMAKYGVKSPIELIKEQKSEFFIEIKQDWAKYKHSKTLLDSFSGQEIEILENYDIEIPLTEKQKTKQNARPEYVVKEINEKATLAKEIEQSSQMIAKKILKSEQNKEQTSELKILYNPNNYFLQSDKYVYPVVKMPKKNSLIKLPRIGRSNQKGFKENDFYNKIKQQLIDIDISNNYHIVIPNFNKPYEPDIVLFDKTLNLYIDIEIDEPYDGYFRYPTHFLNPEDESKQDNIRDLFFTESGWVVIRFTEKQVHLQTNECIDFIKNTILSLKNKPFIITPNCLIENQWDYHKSIQWQKINYRERYLGIERFRKQLSTTEIEIDTNEIENIEKVIKRTEKFHFNNWNNNIAFDEETHKYLHPKDKTGNAEYISVTTLIERFFPFDLKRYIERKAEDEKRTEEDVLDEYLLIRDEASAKGTELHEQIEKYLKFNLLDSESNELKMFINFFNKEIKTRKLQFYEAEKIIFSNNHNVAGIIDCLFKKEGVEEYVMLDWKRSKKLIIDGRPRVYGFGYALSELNSLDNSSYNRYCIQQNIYKYILESEYGLKISSMKLVVLHENYSEYHIVDVPIMNKETNIILNSLKVKI